MEKNVKQEAGSEYYDKVFLNPHYDLSWQEYRTKALIREIIHLLRGDEKIFEIGCGTGQLAQALYQEQKCSKYIGFDFSDIAIHKARKLNLFNTNAWIFKADAYGVAKHIDMFFKDSDTVVALEVFEHMRDFEIIDAISDYRKNIKIICSLPTFDEKSHLRFFKDDKAIIKYYENRINIVYIKKIGGWYLFVGDIL